MNGNVSADASPKDSQIQQLWTRYQEVKHHDQIKNALLEDVLTRFELHLQRHTQQAQQDLQNATYWHDQAMHLQNLLNKNSFIAVLIDGDYISFSNSFLRDGEAGGKRAAKALRNAVAEWAAHEISECPDGIRVVIRIFCNVKGLGTFCASSGLINSPSQIENFVRGFNLGEMSADFIDVGQGQDVAQLKVIDSLEHHIQDYHCRQVLLGCGNNKRYMKVLEQYASEADSRLRLTVIEGALLERIPPVLRTQKFPGVFHEVQIGRPGSTDSFRGRVDSRMALNGASDIFAPRTASLESNRATATPSPSARPSGPKTWAAITTLNAHKPLTEITRPIPGQEEAVKRNKAGQRLDTELEYDYNEVQRIKKLKACNQYYIGAGCCHFNAGKEDKCPHGHDFKFTKQDLKWLRVVARETPCKRGHTCVDPSCIYGHHCPFPPPTEGSMRGIGCMNGDNCRFQRSMHNMDLVPVRMIKATGAF